MTRGFTEKLRFSNGYVPNMNKVGDARLRDGLDIGSKNVWIEGIDRIRSWDGIASYASFGNTIMQLVGRIIGTIGSGNVVRFRDGMTWCVGSGKVSIGDNNGSVQFSGNASSDLQFANALGTLVMAGIPKPVGTPVITPVTTISSTNVTGRINGAISIRVSYRAFDTKAEGNASEPSASVTFTDGVARFTFPASPLPISRNPIRVVYSSRRGFGKFGPWFKLVEVPFLSPESVSNVTQPGNSMGPASDGQFYYTWSDGDLKSIFAPIDFDPPDGGATHVFSLGNVLCVVYPGGRIVASIPNSPESYSPDGEVFLDPQEDVTRVIGRPGDGWLYLACRNSIHTANFREDISPAIFTRSIYSNSGIANPNACALYGDVLYYYSALKGFRRTGGGSEPDPTFAINVESEPARMGWNPDFVCVGYHEEEDAVFYIHKTIALVYKIKLNQWCAPFDMRDGGIPAGQEVTSCVTIGGKLVIATGTADGTRQQFVITGGNSTTIPFKAVPFWKDGGEDGEGYLKRVDHYRFAYELRQGATIRAILRTNFDLSTARDILDSQQGAGIGKYSAWRYTNIPDVLSFTLEFEGQGGNASIYNGIVLGGKTTMRV